MMTALEHYVLEAELDQNYSFILYQGYRRSDNTSVLIKLATSLLAGDEFLVHRFRNLTRQAAQLEHPNIIPTSEVEQENNLIYAVQAWVQAPTLAETLQAEGPFSRIITVIITGLKNKGATLSRPLKFSFILQDRPSRL